MTSAMVARMNGLSHLLSLEGVGNVGIQSRRNERNLLYGSALFGVKAFAFGTVAFDGSVVRKASHRMKQFAICFVLNTLPLGIFFTADFAFLTPETDVG